MERSGDTGRQQLGVGVGEGDFERKCHARPRHDLALEGVAVDVDDARQDQMVLHAYRMDAAGNPFADGDDTSPFDDERGGDRAVRGQDP